MVMFTRRHLLGTASATTLGVVAGPRSLSAARAPVAAAKPLKIGLASYSLRKLSLVDALAACKSLDVRYLTVKDMHLPRTDAPDVLKASVAKIQAAGITITGGGVINWKPDPKKSEAINDAFEAQVRKDFEYARICGFPMIVASPAHEALDLVEKLVKEFNMPVAIHNHGPEDKLYPTPKDVYGHIKKRDKRIGLCMDIGHTVRAGGDPVKTAVECADRLMDMHIKDLRKEGDKWNQVEVGRGQIDIVGLFRSIVKIRFEGHVALEYEIQVETPLPGIRESLGYLRGIAAVMGVLEKSA